MRAVLAATIVSFSILYTNGFVFRAHEPSRRISAVKPLKVGGRGWENDSFLDSLGGSDEDRDEAAEAYNEFKESREAFNQRQKERMKSDAVRKFMRDRAMQQEQAQPEDFDGNMGMGGYEDMFPEVQAGSGGGTSFNRMMQRAENTGAMRGPPGFEQKLAVPLEDDDEDNQGGE